MVNTIFAAMFWSQLYYISQHIAYNLHFVVGYVVIIYLGIHVGIDALYSLYALLNADHYDSKTCQIMRLMCWSM